VADAAHEGRVSDDALHVGARIDCGGVHHRGDHHPAGLESGIVQSEVPLLGGDEMLPVGRGAQR
jgi:hypothetical protein